MIRNVALYAAMVLMGLASGGLFFWGLWRTIDFARTRMAKAGVLIGSFFVRMALIAGAAVAALRLSDAYGLFAFMAGVLCARLLATRLIGRVHD